MYAFLRNAGAPECSGERRGGDHACSAALAIAAVKLKKNPSLEEHASITQILVKSGIIRDSLVSDSLHAGICRTVVRVQFVRGKQHRAECSVVAAVV